MEIINVRCGHLFLTLAVVLSLLQGSINAQSSNTDSVKILQTIEVKATPIRQKPTGERHEKWIKEDLQKNASINLGQFLSMQSGVFVKSYGLGSSATTSMRGGSAGHTQVIWNGLPIQNPMLGQLDFSLIPMGFIDQMSVAYGGNTATWGSGAIGGTIFLENEPIDNKGIKINTRSEIGSFGWWDQQASLYFGNEKFRQSIRFFHQQAENDFTFSVSPDLPEKTQTNAALKQNGLLQELYWTPKSNQQFSAQIWLQETDREIPPRTVQTRSEAKQSDRFIRTSLNWKRTGQQGVLSVQGGLFKEEQDYVDPLAGVDAENDFWKAIGEVEQQWQISASQNLQVGINHTWLQSAAAAYRQSRQQNRSSVFGFFRQNFGNLEAQINVRQELVDGAFAPIVPGVGIQSQIKDWLSIKTKVSRNYRLPTLNDLYWRPGGNENLQPENGWSEEIGIEIKKQVKFEFIYSATAFNRNINDWIQWAVVDGQNFYSPYNITKVWSRGIEQRINLHFNFKKIKMQLNGGYDIIRSTYQQAVKTPKFEKGEQLAYTPTHQWFGQLLIKFKNATFSYLHRHTGKVSTLNFSELSPYHIGNLQIDYSLKLSQLKFHLFFRTENIWNTDYEVIEYRAMPGQHFRMGINIEFFNQKN